HVAGGAARERARPLVEGRAGLPTRELGAEIEPAARAPAKGGEEPEVIPERLRFLSVGDEDPLRGGSDPRALPAKEPSPEPGLAARGHGPAKVGLLLGHRLQTEASCEQAADRAGGLRTPSGLARGERDDQVAGPGREVLGLGARRVEERPLGKE